MVNSLSSFFWSAAMPAKPWQARQLCTAGNAQTRRGVSHNGSCVWTQRLDSLEIRRNPIFFAAGVCRARDARAVVAPVRRLEPFACSVPLLQRDEREPRDGPDSLVRVRAGDIVRVEEGLNPFPRKSDRAGKWQVGVGCSRNRQCQGAEQAGQKAGVQPTLHRALQEGRPSSDLASLALSTAGATILFSGEFRDLQPRERRAVIGDVLLSCLRARAAGWRAPRPSIIHTIHDSNIYVDSVV